MRPRPLFALALAAALCGCLMVPIPGPRVIEIPPGLTRQAVEIAVLAGINDSNVPPSYDPSRELPQPEFDAMLDRDYLSLARMGAWYPEIEKDGVRYASVDTRGHHLLVGIHLGLEQLTIEFVESRNLNQRGHRIHRKVPLWIENLATHIERELKRMSVRARPPGGSPAGPSG